MRPHVRRLQVRLLKLEVAVLVLGLLVKNLLLVQVLLVVLLAESRPSEPMNAGSQRSCRRSCRIHLGTRVC